MRSAMLSAITALVAAALLLPVPGTRAMAGEAEKEEAVPLEKVPEVVKEAAKKAVPGIVLTAAFKEVEQGRTVYEIKGKVGQKKYEIEVTPEGKVLEVEEDDDDKDEKDDDD